MSSDVSFPAAPSRSWLLGPGPDLLLGTGLAYVAIFLWLLTDVSGLTRVFPMAFLVILAVFVSVPHYGATLLRVYARRSDRRAYFYFAVHATVLLTAIFLWGLFDTAVGCLVFTVYLTWSPWHYTGQNYGIALMFLYRNGVKVPPVVKRWLYASFVSSYVITFAFIHGSYAKRDLAPEEIGFVPFGFPPFALDLFLVVAAVVYLYATLSALWPLAKTARLRALLPAIVLVFVQSSWFVVPALYRNWFPYGGLEGLTAAKASYFFVWVALGHAIQYLWITTYFAKTSGRARTYLGFYATALIAGALIWIAPELLLQRSGIGPLPYDAGLALMIAAIVNLHHFVLDGAIWKLRDGPIARALLVREPAPAEQVELWPRRPSWRFPAIAALGGLAVLARLFGIWERQETVAAIEHRDFARAEAGIERLAWIGRESAALRTALGSAQAGAGLWGRGRRQIEAGLAFHPTASGWFALGHFRGQNQEWTGAVRAYEKAIELRPESVSLQCRLAEASYEAGETERAEAILRDVWSLHRGNPRIREAMERLGVTP